MTDIRIVRSSAVSISDTTLKEQEDLKIRPEKEKMRQLIDALKTEDEKQVVEACDTLAHGVFIPWLNKQNQANKLYFAKKGGIALCVKWMKDGTHEDTQAYAGTAVWNFSESGVMHEILWNNGAVDALLGFLKSPSHRLQRVAVGALFGLLDYDSNSGAYLALNYEKELVQTLIGADQLIPSFSFRLAKTGCLLSLAKHPSTREEVYAKGGSNIFSEDQPDVLINFLNALGLAHLLAEGTEVQPSDKEKYFKVMESQFSRTPKFIREKESQHGLVWSSVKHHLRLMRDSELIIRHLALLSLANLSFSDYNRKLMVEEDILDDITCMQWIDDGVHESRKLGFIETISENFGGLPVPSLFHMCSSYIHRKTPELVEYIPF